MEIIKMKDLTPSSYRLLKKKNNTTVLQGAFTWKGLDENGKNITGISWEDIPTVIEEE